MKARLCTLASGSEGNSVYLSLGSKHFLVDAGLSFRQLEEALARLGLAPEQLDALFLTHEHIDHVKGLPALLKRKSLPVYATYGSFDGLAEQGFFPRLPKECFHLFRKEDTIQVGDVRISTIPISHDAREAVAFRFDTEAHHLAVVTDLGCDEGIPEAFQALDALVLEANHDRRMLEAGPYPYPLKLRIDGDKGHLSNEAAGRLLLKLMHSELKAVLLGHLSRTNNYPLLARETVGQILQESWRGPMPHLKVAPARGLSEVIEIE